MGKKSKFLRSSVKLKRPRRITAGLTDHEHPVVSPDRQHIAFYAGIYGAIQVFACDMDGRFARLISHPWGNNTQPAWHPGGRRLAYRHQDTPRNKWEIWEADLLSEDAPRLLLADERWSYKHPSYDPAGNRLTYFSDEGEAENYNLWLLDLATGGRRQLTDTTDQNDCHSVFSPDGQRLVYHVYEEARANHDPALTNLFELNLADGCARRLTEGRDQFKHPFYLDDTTISFHHEVNATGIRSIGLLDLASLQRTYLTDGSDNDKHPFPWTDEKGRRWIAWASKKLGSELEGEEKTYDIFVAQIRGLPQNRPAAEPAEAKPAAKKKQAAQRAKKLIALRRKDFKPNKDNCSTCPIHKVIKGEMTSWDQAAKFKVKGRNKACKKCPARMVLDYPEE